MNKRRFTGRPAADFDFQAIQYGKAGGRATITFNRPEVLNAFNSDVLYELNLALRDAAWDDAVGVVVLTGAGERARMGLTPAPWCAFARRKASTRNRDRIR